MIETRSIGRRLTLLLAGVAALLSLLSWAMVTGLAREGTQRTQDNVLTASVTAMAETLAELSDGAFTIEQFPANALGGEREMVEGAQIGTVDLVITSTGPVGNFVPDTLLTDIPFLFRDYDTKSAMIAELRRPITVEMVTQEINRYADSEFRYADKSDEAAIAAMVREFGRQDEARRRYMEGKA